MSKLLQMATDIVSAHASTSTMSKKELLAALNDVYAALSTIENGEASAEVPPVVEDGAAIPAISKRTAFGKNSITCMLCGKKMQTLKRHLGTAHGMKPGEYRKQFGIPTSQPLVARAYSESRKQMALDRDLGANLARARAARGKGKKAEAPVPPAEKVATKKRAPRKPKGTAATK
jgi:predicted transcriptional regulator